MASKDTTPSSSSKGKIKILSPSSSSKGKRKILSFREKYEVIQDYEKGLSRAQLQEKYGLKKTTMHDLIKSKDKVKEVVKEIESGMKADELFRRRRPILENLDKALYNWYTRKRADGVPIRGIDLQHAAQRFAGHLGHENFDCSEGWLWRFRRRHGIANKAIAGELPSADVDAVDRLADPLLTVQHGLPTIYRRSTALLPAVINPETRIDETPPRESSLPAVEDRSGSEFSHHNSGGDEPIPVSPEHFLSEGTEQDEPAPVPPTPSQQQKPESYQLRHNNHLTIVLEALARDESFMDVTLTAQGRSLKAHKSVLSAVSSYFRGVLRDNPCQHPIIIMPRDVRFEELYSIVNYIYKGEMTVAAEDLTSLLKTAEILQVSGLAPSDSTATVNPQTESLPMGEVRSSSNSSSSTSSSSNIVPVLRTSKTVKTTSQSLSTPPARPKSIDSMINPADFIDVDMTCVKEEVESEGEEGKEERKRLCSQPPGPQQAPQCSQPPGGQRAPQCSQPPQCSQTATDAKDDDDAPDDVILGFPSPYEQSFDQPMPSTSSHEAEFRSLGVKSDPEKGFNSQATKFPDNPQPLKCPHCDEQYHTAESIECHLRLKHPTKPSFICKCGRIFTRQIHHQAHTRMCSNAS